MSLHIKVNIFVGWLSKFSLVNLHWCISVFGIFGAFCTFCFSVESFVHNGSTGWLSSLFSEKNYQNLEDLMWVMVVAHCCNCNPEENSLK